MSNYIFIYGDDSQSYRLILGAHDFDEALKMHYERTGIKEGISIDLFYSIVKGINSDQAIEFFNSLNPTCKIKAVYSGLKVAYKEVVEV